MTDRAGAVPDLSWFDALIAGRPESPDALTHLVGPLELREPSPDKVFDRRNKIVERRPPYVLMEGTQGLAAGLRWCSAHRYPGPPSDHAAPAAPFIARIDMRFEASVPHEAITSRLEAALGPPCAVTRATESYAEYGKDPWWVYTKPFDDGTYVGCTWRRDAVPVVSREAQRRFMHALVAQLGREERIEPILSALAPEQAAVNAQQRPSDPYSFTFSPPLPASIVSEALGWTSPVAFSGDVHFKTWWLVPHRRYHERDDPHVGCWRLEMQLDRWPKGPDVGRAGPSPVIDMRRCDGGVEHIELVKRLRPELPVITDAHRRFMHALVEQLGLERRIEPIRAAIAQPLAEVNGQQRGSDPYTLTFPFPLPLSVVVEALGWTTPLARLRYIEMNSWLLVPHGGSGERDELHVGCWRLEIELDYRHKGLERVPDGASPLIDLRGIECGVVSIELVKLPSPD